MSKRIPRYWLAALCLAIACAIEIWLWGTNATFDTQTTPGLQSIKVQTGYALVFENSAAEPSETILSYQSRESHHHAVTLNIENAALDSQTSALLGLNNAKAPIGKLLYAPSLEEHPKVGPPCQTGITVNFVDQTPRSARSVTLYPARPDEYDPEHLRTVHLRSDSPLLIRASDSSADGINGPNCKNTLTIGQWEQEIGKDIQVGFIAPAGGEITLQVAPDSTGDGRFQEGPAEEEPLEIEPLHPIRLKVTNVDGSRVQKIYQRANTPIMTVSKLHLGSDAVELNLSGSVAIPMTNYLGIWKWPLLAALNVPLSLWLALVVRRHRRVVTPPSAPQPPAQQRNIFLSYSWGDKDRVMQIYKLLENAGADLWLDREELRGGDEWELRIKQQMRNCEQIIIFLSKSALEHKGYLWREIRMAADVAEEQPEGKAFIIPVKLDECTLPNVLSHWNCLELSQPQGELQLLKALGLMSSHNAAS